jgi:CelD/BcsL family acetyltransferase involved in cellulose biosynthesis
MVACRREPGNEALSGTQVIEVNAAADGRWAALADREGCLFHSAPWAQVLADTYGFDVRGTLILDPSGDPVAGVSHVTVEDLNGPRTVVLPFSDYANPIVRTESDHLLLCSRLRATGAPTRIGYLTESEDPAGSPDRAVVRRAHWHGVPIADDLDSNWSMLAPATRRAVRKARRNGVRVEAVDDDVFLRELFRLHLGVRKRKYRLLPQPREFFAVTRDRFTTVDGWWPLVARHHGRIVAATLYLQWRNTLYYKFNASDPDSLAFRPNNLLLWEGIRLAHRRRCGVLDLGRSDDEQPGLARFKRGFGAQASELLTMELSPTGAERRVVASDEVRSRAALARITSQLTDPAVPDRATEVAGSVLYRLFA